MVRESESGRLYVCDDCQEEKSGSKEIKVHICIYHWKVKFTCDSLTCTASYDTSRGLDYHCQSHHKEEEQAAKVLLKCIQCPKTFHNQYNKDKHELAHASCPVYECPWCHKKFSKKYDAEKHHDTKCIMNPVNQQCCLVSKGLL